MKLRTHRPEIITIEGEEEVAAVNDPPPKSNYGGHNRIKAAYDAGYFTRAIVCKITDFGTNMYDPHNWGIVVDCHPDRAFHIEIAWADGKRSHHQGSELKVIHRGGSIADFQMMLEKGTRH